MYDKAVSKLEVGGYSFEVEMSDFSDPYLIDRKPSACHLSFRKVLKYMQEKFL